MISYTHIMITTIKGSLSAVEAATDNDAWNMAHVSACSGYLWQLSMKLFKDMIMSDQLTPPVS